MKHNNLDKRCLDTVGLNFIDFMNEYYFSHNLTYKECAGLIGSHASIISKLVSELEIDIRRKHSCEYCGNIFVANTPFQRFCTSSCTRKNNWNKAKPAHRKCRKQRGLDRKNKLLELYGGKCGDCGYNKFLAALSFHHIDESTKLFTLDQKNLCQKTWEEILEESQKCRLLCQNCHSIHHEIERNAIFLLNQDNYQSDFVKKRQKGQERKRRLIQMSGDKCEKCGFFSSYLQCFTFHHLISEEKGFALNTNKLQQQSWANILDEWAKCQLLCFNCHMKIEHPQSENILET